MKRLKHLLPCLLLGIIFFQGCSLEEIVISVEASGNMSMVYCDSGTRYVWGSNAAFKTEGEAERSLAPQALEAVDGVIDFACGAESSVFLTMDGVVISGKSSMESSPAALSRPSIVYGFGDAAADVSKKYDTITVSVPMEGVKKVESGEDNVIVLKEDGSVWGWGANDANQLGSFEQDFADEPVQISALIGITDISVGATGLSAALDGEGNVWIWGAGLGVPQKASGLSGITQVVCGRDFRAAVDSEGNVYTWGRNHSGQLGYISDDVSEPGKVSGLPKILSLSAGNGFVLAVDYDGNVWSWGDNSAGQLGRNAEGEAAFTPGKCEGIDGVLSLSTGYGHVVALKKDGTVWTWGDNSTGQLGREAGEFDHVPGMIDALTYKAGI